MSCDFYQEQCNFGDTFYCEQFENLCRCSQSCQQERCVSNNTGCVTDDDCFGEAACDTDEECRHFPGIANDDGNRRAVCR